MLFLRLERPHAQGPRSLSAATSFPSCAVCSQLTKARGQRGVGVASGIRAGGANTTWAEEAVNGASE